MNTIAWSAGALATLWMSVFGFETINIDAIGFSMAGVFLFCLVMIVHSGFNDIHWIRGGRDD